MLKLSSIIDSLIGFARKFPLLNRLPVNFYRFAIVGFSGFMFDFIIFRILFDVVEFRLKFFNLISAANVTSVLCSTVFTYIVNKKWSFEDKADNVAAQFGKYATVAIINNTLNNLFFGFLFYRVFANSTLSVTITSSIAKMFATSFQAVTSYIAYKYFVFPRDKEVLSETIVP